ncbi:recombinase family protein [Escherichia coli]|uniref:recombinase family protein n=3 Tax=Enterobacteriaceae TaxID=543 RepID=UPI0019D47E33|nr:recombinase family protein [Escherichia coli]
MKDKPMIGYARVSTDDQDLTNQRAELHAAGCTRIFAEKITGTHAKRPELGRMLDHLRAGDVVTVTRLDRLARSTRDLLDIAEQLQAKGAGLRSLAEPWADTTTPAGRMVLTVFAGIAEFERSLIIDRTRNGTVAKLAMRQPFVLFKGLTFQKLCLPGAFRPGDHHNKMLRPGLCVVHASPQYL